MNKTVAKVWTFQSDSNPNKTYETLYYTDNSTSCNCPGWTRRTAADGSRSCKHTRLVDQNRADADAVSSHDYNKPKQYGQTKKVQENISIPVVRKIRWK